MKCVQSVVDQGNLALPLDWEYSGTGVHNVVALV
jgi:hypothetical protein